MFKHGKRKGGNPTMEPLVPNQTPIVGVPGIPVNTNVTLEDKNRNQEINNPDFNKLQVNMTIPTMPQQSPSPVNPTNVDPPITLEDLAKGDNPVVTPQDIANGAIVVDGGTGTNNTAVNNNNVNVNGGNIMNQQMNMNQQQIPQQQAQAQQYYQQMPIPPQQQQNEEGGFFSSPTVKMVGVGVACAAAGYLGHKYMSASDSAEVAAALGELL